MEDVISDSNLISERLSKLAQDIPIEHSQLSLDKYLDRLSVKEREGIADLANAILLISKPYFRKHFFSYSIFAIGTTTYSDEYWDEINEKSIVEPSLREYATRRGEDIDLMFVPEHGGEFMRLIDYRLEKKYKEKLGHKRLPSQREIFLARKKISQKINAHTFRNAKLTGEESYVWKECFDLRTMITGACMERGWKNNAWQYYAPSGAYYFDVPKEHQEKHGVIFRQKSEQYGMLNMRIKMPECRDFHIYIDNVQSRASKIEYERAINIPFAVVKSIGTNLDDVVAKKNGTYVERTYSKPSVDEDELPF